MGHFLPYAVFQIFHKEFTSITFISRKSIPLNIKEEPIIYTKSSPVTLAFTGSGCSFLSLPNSISIAQGAKQEWYWQWTDAPPCSRQLLLGSSSPFLHALLQLPSFTNICLPPGATCFSLCLSLSEGLLFLCMPVGKLHGYLCLIKDRFPNHVS